MKKIKKLVYAGMALILTAPVSVSAQWIQPRDNPHLVGSGLSSQSIFFIILSGMRWVLGIVGFLAVIAFAIAGILYLTSAGNENQAGTAKKAMLYAIIGVVIALVGLIIVTAVDNWLFGPVNPTF